MDKINKRKKTRISTIEKYLKVGKNENDEIKIREQNNE